MGLGENRAERISLRGIKQEHFDTTNITSTLKCVVYCKSVPPILLCSSFLQFFKPVVVICPKQFVAQIITIISKDTLVVDESERSNYIVINKIGNDTTLGLVDGSINSGLCKWFTSIGIKSLLATGIPRRLHTSWTRMCVQVDHKDYGGVTDSLVCFNFLSQSPVE